MKNVLPILVCCLASCTSTPYRYQSAQPQCLEYSIASCRAAIIEDGLEAGLIHYVPIWGGGASHCVIWVRDENGRERIYDPSYGRYRTISDKAVILHRGDGVDLGIYAALLGRRKDITP